MVYEIDPTIDELDIRNINSKEIEINFSNVKLIENKRCSVNDVCFGYALNKISSKLGVGFCLYCKDGFYFLENYFKQIPIEKARKGDIITYHEISNFKSQYEKPCAENCMHFAIIHETDRTLENTLINSKWGEKGVFKTKINDVPDSFGNAVLIWEEKKMKKFKVSADNIEYLLTTEIEANSKEEAIDVYLKMWEEGMIEVNDSEMTNVNAKEK